MRLFDSIGLGFFILSIISVVLWSPRQYSIPHISSSAKVSEEKSYIWEKNKDMAFKGDLSIGEKKIDAYDKLQDSYKKNMIDYDRFENTMPKRNSNHKIEVVYETQDEALGSCDTKDTSSKDLNDTNPQQSMKLYEIIQNNDQTIN